MIILSEQDILNRVPDLVDKKYVSMVMKCIAIEIQLLRVYDRSGSSRDAAVDYNEGLISLGELTQRIGIGSGSKMTRAILMYVVLLNTMPEKKWRICVTDDMTEIPFVLSTYRSEDYVAILSGREKDVLVNRIRRGRYRKICTATEAMDVAVSEYKYNAETYVQTSAYDAITNMYGDIEYMHRINEIERILSKPNTDSFSKTIEMVDDILDHREYMTTERGVLINMFLFSAGYNRVLRAYMIFFKNINPCSTSPGIPMPTHPMFSGF
jgi:hypothetical protein